MNVTKGCLTPFNIKICSFLYKEILLSDFRLCYERATAAGAAIGEGWQWLQSEVIRQNLSPSEQESLLCPMSFEPDQENEFYQKIKAWGNREIKNALDHLLDSTTSTTETPEIGSSTEEVVGFTTGAVVLLGLAAVGAIAFRYQLKWLKSISCVKSSSLRVWRRRHEVGPDQADGLVEVEGGQAGDTAQKKVRPIPLPVPGHSVSGTLYNLKEKT